MGPAFTLGLDFITRELYLQRLAVIQGDLGTTMTNLRFYLLALVLLCATVAFAADDPYADPDWGYSYTNPHYLPDNPPAELEAFWHKMIPMMEARHSGESAYLREYSKELLNLARDVKGSLEGGSSYQRHFYNKAASDLIRACKELHVLSYGAPSHSLYSEMHVVEEAYVRLANLCE